MAAGKSVAWAALPALFGGGFVLVLVFLLLLVLVLLLVTNSLGYGAKG
jgi:hypothetical protein